MSVLQSNRLTHHRRMYYLSIIITLVILFTPLKWTTDAQTGLMQPSAPASSDPNDSAELKRRFVETINDAIKRAEAGLKKPLKRTFSDGKVATYHAEYTGQLSYDIRKTDSLVSPYLGVVSWKIRWYHNGKLVNRPFSFDAHYAYQDGQWVLKDLVRRIPSLQGGSKELPADEYFDLFK